jgi:hypothetical protein
MRPALIDALLVLALVASVAVAIARTPRGMSDLGAQVRVERSGAEVESLTAAHTLRESTLRRSIFRLDGALPGELVATAPEPAPAAVPPAPTYTVSVRAIIGGPPWRAALVGLPGALEVRVVRPGDRFGPVEVRDIQREDVILAIADSAWRVSLPARRP